MIRRHFIATAATGLAVSMTTHADEPSNKLVVGIMGTGGRGTALAQSFARQPGVEIAYVCDVDKKRADNAAGVVAKIANKAPKAVQDFRKVLDDNAVDVLVVATCNHWHAPAAILGCAAGKHVYVEKPCSHNPREGELLVDAARKYRKQVQVGNQRRSWEKIQEATELVRKGEAIGRPYFAHSWYASDRGGIGKGKETAPPEQLDYDLWQGPAPRRPYSRKYLTKT
jgi:predicted dehydrogenase